MLYTGNPYIIQPGNVFFMHMILMDSDSNLAMNLGETYLVTENGNERLGSKGKVSVFGSSQLGKDKHYNAILLNLIRD